MVNKRQKSIDQLQDRRPERTRSVGMLAPVTDAARIVPRTPPNLQPQAQRRWRSYWASAIAQIVDRQSDAEALHRWIHAVSERERLQPQADAEPLVSGSMGQQVANPLYGVINSLSREIERLEDHLGMTPLARLRLGLVQTQQALGVADLRERLDRRGAVRPDDDGAIEADVVINLDELA